MKGRGITSPAASRPPGGWVGPLSPRAEPFLRTGLRERLSGADSTADDDSVRRPASDARRASRGLRASPADSGVQDELARIKRAVKASPASVQSPRQVSPPRRSSVVGLNATPTLGTPGTQVSEASEVHTPVGMLQHALSTRETRTNQLLGEKEAQLSHQSREIAELQGAAEEMREQHAIQVQALENKISALQRQFQKALHVEALTSPRKGAAETESELRSAMLRADKAERELERLSEALAGANSLLHSVQDDLNQERLERARLVSTTRLDVRKELEQAHLDIVDEQKTAFASDLEEREEAHNRVEEKLRLELDRMKTEYADLEKEREQLWREHQSSSAELERVRSSAITSARDLDDLEKLRGESDRHNNIVAELRSFNKRLQSREGTLEARIVELELSAGLAQEEAAGEERMKAAAELETLQGRHRSQSKRDAEELGRLRGMLSAAEAKLELSDEVNASLDVKVESLQRQLLESVANQSTTSNQMDARALQLEQAEHKVQQLEKNLADNRALLGRQAGQLQATSERTTSLENRLQDAQERLHQFEREGAALVAENSESKTTVEVQAAELQKSRFSCDLLEDKVETANLRVTELEVEAANLRQQMESASLQVKQAEDRAHGLEAAIASQASTLRTQLQVDAESQYTLRLSRERTAWESSSMELEQHLEVACRRRRHQAVLAAASVAKSRAHVTLATGLKHLALYAKRRRLNHSTKVQERLHDEMESMKRRELSLIEELDDMRSETASLQEHFTVRKASQAGPRLVEREVDMLRRWGCSITRYKCFDKWMLWTRDQSRLRQKDYFACSTSAAVEMRSMKALMRKCYSRWLTYSYQMSRLRFLRVSHNAANVLSVKCTNSIRSQALSRWGAFHRTKQRKQLQASRVNFYGELAVMFCHRQSAQLLGGSFARWTRFWHGRVLARTTQADKTQHRQECNALEAEVKRLQGLVQEITTQADEVVDKKQRMKEDFASLLQLKHHRLLSLKYLGMWWRWLCYKGIREGIAAQEDLRKQAISDAAQAVGAHKELEENLDELVHTHTDLVERHKEMTDDYHNIRERCNILEKGLAQARHTFTVDMEQLSNANVELESQCETLSNELRYATEELEMMKEQAASGISDTKSKAQSETHVLQEELTLMKATLASAETQRSRSEEEVRVCREEVGRLQTLLKDSEDRVIHSLEELRIAKMKHDEEMRAPRERLSSLEYSLSEARGNISELENQVLGRTAQQRRLASDLEEATTSLAQESEKRKTLERALTEVNNTCAKQAEELVAQVMSLDSQLRIATEENTDFKSRNEALEMEIAEMRGRVSQVDKVRARMGPLSEFKNTPEISEELMQLREENSHREDELTVAAKKIIDAERKVGVLRGKVDAQKLKILDLTERLQEMHAQAGEETRENSGMRQEVEDKENEIMQLQNLVRALRTEADTYNEEYERRGEELKDMQEEMEVLRQRIAAFEERAQHPSAEVMPPATQSTSPQGDHTVPPPTPLLPDPLDDAPEPSLTYIERDVSPEPPAPASPPVEPSQSAPPASPPSPFGRKARRELPPPSMQPVKLTQQDTQRLEWIFQYGDSDTDGYLNFPELQRLSNDTAGGLDREQYESILEVLGAPREGLRIEHLGRLYLELGSPGDIDDNYESLQLLQAQRAPPQPTDVPVLPDLSSAADQANLNVSFSDPPSPGGRVLHHSTTSDVPPVSPRNRSPSQSMRSTSSVRRVPFPYGTSGSLPFRVQNTSKADPDPIVTVAASQIKSLPRAALIIEVTNRTTGESCKIATRDQFLFATTEQSGAFEGTKLTLKVVKEPSAIKQWRETVKAKKGKRVYPSMSKTLIEEVTVTIGPMTDDGREGRKQALMKKAALHDLPSGNINTDTIFTLMHAPEKLRASLEAKLSKQLSGASGAVAMAMFYKELHELCGFPAPYVEEFDVMGMSGDNFDELWRVARAGYLRAFHDV